MFSWIKLNTTLDITIFWNCNLFPYHSFAEKGLIKKKNLTIYNVQQKAEEQLD